MCPSYLILQVNELCSLLTRSLENFVQNKVQDIRVASESTLVQRTVAALQLNEQRGSSWHELPPKIASG